MNADLKTWVRAEWDRVTGVGLVAAGVVALLLGYLGVSRSTDTPEALCYVVSGGIGSVLLFGAGAVLLISADLHDEWRKLNRIAYALERLAGDEGPTIELSDAAIAAHPASAVPGHAPAKSAPVLRSLARAQHGAGDGRFAVVGAATGTLSASRSIGMTGCAVGAGALALAWWTTSQQLTARAAYEGLAASLGALLLSAVLGAGGLGWSQRVVERRKSAVLSALAEVPADEDVMDDTSLENAELGDGWVAVAEGLPEYHRPSCVAFPSQSARTMPAAAVPADLRPCRLCEP